MLEILFFALEKKICLPPSENEQRGPPPIFLFRSFRNTHLVASQSTRGKQRRTIFSFPAENGRKKGETMSFISLTRFEGERKALSTTYTPLLFLHLRAKERGGGASYIYCACLWEFTCSGRGLVYSSGFFTGRYVVLLYYAGYKAHSRVDRKKRKLF